MSEVDSNKHKYQIKLIINIDTPVAIVFDALTTKEGIQGWWTPDTKMEPVTGFIAEFIFGERYHNKMRIVELKKDELVKWLCIEGDKEWIGTDFTFDLEYLDNKTIVRFGQNNWEAQTDFFAYCNFQWSQYLISLKKFCETGKGTPFVP